MAKQLQKANGQLSMKRIGVDKTNARIVIITAAAAFAVVFFLVASISLFGTLSYQNRIIRAKKQAVSQLKKNVTAVTASDGLISSYKKFADSSTNFIGGSATEGGPQDGRNPKIVLDALPSKYDFPALAASLEKIAADQRVNIQSITGNDDEVAQTDQAKNDPSPVDMPFEIKVGGDYSGIQRVVDAFDHSIRPIQIQKMQITGDQKELSIDITAKTFYQPQKTLNIRTTVIK